MYDAIAMLCTPVVTQDAYGNEIETSVKTQVNVEPKSIGMRESYLAAQVGLKPDITLVLSDHADYTPESKYVLYEDVLYTISRTYRNGSTLELTLTRKDGSNV